jgi:uncharacterized protein (DUF849 family)
MARSVIVSCAITGGGDTVGKHPAIPVTPAQIAQSSIEAAGAGAAIVHIHVRDPQTGKPSLDQALYAEVTQRIRDSGTDVIINLTTGAGARYIPGDDNPTVGAPGSTVKTPDFRTQHIADLKPEICSLDVGTFNFGENVFMNTPAHLRKMAANIKAAGVKPELEVFDSGQIRLATHLIDSGLIDAPPLFQICLGIAWAAPATPEAMTFMRDLLPKDALWASFGIGPAQFPMVAQAVLLGGNVRVGLEDNLYLEKGVYAPTNASLVEKAAKIITLLGATLATPNEARALLGLKTKQQQPQKKAS